MLSRLRIVGISIFFCGWLCGCTTFYNPATGKNESLFIDTNTEVSLGLQMDEKMQSELTLVKDARAKLRLEAIGERIAFSCDRNDLAYHFRVVKDEEFNAFAIPGGFVYVNSGLLQAANDDELACVVAHEIGHIAARHSVKKLQSALGYQLVVGIALGVSGQQSMGQAMNIVYDLISLGYSRKDEFLADTLSVRYARKAGFNPLGMVSFFEKLKAQSGKGSSHYNPVFLSSHPSIDDRIAHVKREIELTGT